MEYVKYVLIILAMLAVCLWLVRIPGQVRLKANQAALSERARRRKENQQPSRAEVRKQKLHQREVLLREIGSVPTPWGWPGHESHPGDGYGNLKAEEVHGVSESLHRFVDRLVKEKKTVDSREYQLKKNISIRSMVEDRYGRSASMPEVDYRRVEKPPLLRDPSQPHDQMDNFANGKTDQIESGLSGQPRSPEEYYKKIRKKTTLQEVKKPWGW
jgi:hypothetical protein